MYRVNTIMYSTWHQWKGLLNAKSLLGIVPMVHKYESPICSSPMLQVNCIILHNAGLTPPLTHPSDPSPPIPLVAPPKNSTCKCDTRFSQASKDDIQHNGIVLGPILYNTIDASDVWGFSNASNESGACRASGAIVKWCNWSLWYSLCKAFL